MASSRRSAGEIHILAMLDGLGTRTHARRNMLWYGAAGVVVCGLIGTLAWLAHEPATRQDSRMVSSPLPPAPAEASAASTPPIPIERGAEVPAAPAAPQPPSGGAAIVDVADSPAAVPATPAPADPPPRMLPAPTPAPALHAPAPKHPAAAVASVHPGHARVKHNTPRNTPLVKPVAAPAAVDTDVALISAIIQHAAKQHEATEDGCAGKDCGPRMPAKP